MMRRTERGESLGEPRSVKHHSEQSERGAQRIAGVERLGAFERGDFPAIT
jgi:hypothetical protein